MKNVQCLAYLACVFTVILLDLTDGKVLDDYILHYEELTYNTEHVHSAHLRHKRSIDSAVHLELNAFNNPLKLRLTHNAEAFAPDFVLEFNGTVAKPDLSFLYKGEVIDKPGSNVNGAIIEGVFRGTIKVPSEQEVYHVEKSSRFFTDQPVFHSVIYKERHMNLDPFRERRTREKREAKAQGTCGYSNARRWMREVINSEVMPLNRAKRHEKQWQEIHSSEDGQNKYSQSANMNDRSSRKKRATDSDSLYEINNKRDSCFLSLMADVFLFNQYKSQAGGKDDVARDEIVAFFQNHVTALNEIYTTTLFQTYDKSEKYIGVKFAVQKTKIMVDDDCNDASLNRFCQPNVDVSNFLNMNSLIDHDLFCLAYVFTYRDFSQGTLGLAWVGSPSSASGGVCERYKKFTEGGVQVSKSLNTGIVTTINYSKQVPSKISQLTFAHEVGHNFGSPHDDGTLCAPYGSSASDSNEGNYIMFASATQGDKPHNDEFSDCSKDNITRVLKAVLTSTSKHDCFKESGPFCGNGIVEGTEECDCGYTDCTDQCCNGRTDANDAAGISCKLKVSNGVQVQCSPSQGPCCNSDCAYKNSDQICRYATECAASANCTMGTAECPTSGHVLDGTLCSNAGFTCQTGECSGSLCKAIKTNGAVWDECFTTGDTKTKEDREKLCKLACQKPNTNTTADCIISSDTASYPEYVQMLNDVIDTRKTGSLEKGVQLAPGSPCNNFQGYCDVFFRCRGVDAEGPLSRLKNLIFNPETLEDIGNWIVEKWWAVLLMAVGLVLAMGLFIKFCAVHTPSSNPKAKPARKLSETMTLRRKRNQNQNRPLPSQPPKQQAMYDQHRNRPDRGRQYYYDDRTEELLKDPKYPIQNPQGPPPPYPGSSTSASGSHLGPPHGHGKKGKARKGQHMEMGRV